MKKVSVLALLFVFVIGVSASFAIGIPGVGKGKSDGAKLKKAEKEFKLADLNASFKKFEGTDCDPYKAAPYKYNVYGDGDVDTFLTSSHKINATVTFSNQLINDLYAKVDKAETKEDLEGLKKDAEFLGSALAPLVAEGTKLVASGAALAKSAPGKFGNLSNAKVLPSLIKDLGGAVKGLKASGDEIKVITDKIAPLVSKIAEKVAGLAG
jgi:hypothetical protein